MGGWWKRCAHFAPKPSIASIMEPGAPSYAQCVWLCQQLEPIRALLNQGVSCKSVDGLQSLVACANQDVTRLCSAFAATIWTKGIAFPTKPVTVNPDWTPPSLNPQPEIDPVPPPEPDGNTWAVVSSKKYVPAIKPPPAVPVPAPVAPHPYTPIYKAPTKPSPPPKKPVRIVNLRSMSKSAYRRRFGMPTKPVPTRSTPRTVNKSVHVQVHNGKDFASYLDAHGFVETSTSKSNDVRYMRTCCGCGACPPLDPLPTCPASFRQMTVITNPNGKSKHHYWKNKRSHVDQLVRRAEQMHRAAASTL